MLRSGTRGPCRPGPRAPFPRSPQSLLPTRSIPAGIQTCKQEAEAARGRLSQFRDLPVTEVSAGGWTAARCTLGGRLA